MRPPLRPADAPEAASRRTHRDPVLQGEHYQDRPIYFSDVIVQSDSPLSVRSQT